MSQFCFRSASVSARSLSRLSTCCPASPSRSFMRLMCDSRSVKFSVRCETFSCSDRSLASVLQSWTSRQLMALDFSAQMSRRTWISISISFRCLSTSESRDQVFLQLNSSRARRQFSEELFQRDFISYRQTLYSYFFSQQERIYRQFIYQIFQRLEYCWPFIYFCKSSSCRSYYRRVLVSSYSCFICSNYSWQLFYFWNCTNDYYSKAIFCLCCFYRQHLSQSVLSSYDYKCLFCAYNCRTFSFNASYSLIKLMFYRSIKRDAVYGYLFQRFYRLG